MELNQNLEPFMTVTIREKENEPMDSGKSGGSTCHDDTCQ